MLSVEAIKNMLNISFPEIDEQDYNYFEEKIRNLKNYYDKQNYSRIKPTK